MLDDLVIQFFSLHPRREVAVYLLLTGKKTLSTLYSALQHNQLQWLQLLPDLGRDEYQAAVARLVAQRAVARQASGIVLTDPARQAEARQRVPLPQAFRAEWGASAFDQRLSLAVQVLSEAQFKNRRYQPVTNDWHTQQRVRQWTRHVNAKAVVAELTAAFAALPTAQADRLARRFVAHGFVGDARADGLAAHLADLDAVSALIAQLVAHPEWAQLNALWGGPVALFSPSSYQAVALADQGVARAAIAAQLRLKPSTVNEHLLAATIMGWQPPIAQLIPAPVRAALAGQSDPHEQDYQKLLAAVPTSDFFAVRLFQILMLQGRWPND
ncbi:hypothetical protein [Lacticaseibacillus daqingensis]|uniref:hypothetical protein n=1 Tax=Lacticaseibacillus daqingensis TaxID=2486014 RepID=UPI000F78B581|nr:hypothetical protein [Lacticaseibacillus daqingensis]